MLAARTASWLWEQKALALDCDGAHSDRRSALPQPVLDPAVSRGNAAGHAALAKAAPPVRRRPCATGNREPSVAYIDPFVLQASHEPSAQHMAHDVRDTLPMIRPYKGR